MSSKITSPVTAAAILAAALIISPVSAHAGKEGYEKCKGIN